PRDLLYTLSLHDALPILFSSKVDNKIHYCANNREVLIDKISTDIPELDNFLTDKEGTPFSIAVYVEGDFLDDNVNEERTTINFRSEEHTSELQSRENLVC